MIVGIAFAGAIGMALNLFAQRRSAVKGIVVFLYVRLPLAVWLSVYLFREAVDSWSLMGTSAIGVACLIPEWRTYYGLVAGVGRRARSATTAHQQETRTSL
jgi:drug/metabolite transporter (DMT)-like permease